MPVAQEKWISNPLGVVRDLFTQTSDHHDSRSWGVKEYFEAKLNSEGALTQVPSLNHTPLHHTPEGSLVRYQAMVQDQFDPEFYFKVYHMRHRQSGAESIHCGMYKDITEHTLDCELEFNHASNVTGDRLVLYCVPIPGETKWTKEGFHNRQSHDLAFVDDDAPMRTCHKRRLSDNGESSEGMEVSEDKETPSSKRQRESDDVMMTPLPSNSSGHHDMNFPLPDEGGVAALVKVYGDFDLYKVTSIVEFVGVLSVDPSLAHFEVDESCHHDNHILVDPIGGEPAAERKAHSPPPSLIPRLHAITARILGHSCPLLPRELTPPVNSSVIAQLVCDVPTARKLTFDLLTQALTGDRLAAEYTLLHLLSSVYGRTDVLALGKFSLNLTKCTGAGPNGSSVVDTLSALIHLLVPKCHLLRMSLNNMNKATFSPVKDYSANRLSTGLLQLSDGTHLVVDETALTPGQLTEVGVRNLTALGNVIQWQKVHYDFQYHTSEFDCNLPVLMLSEAKSILQTDCHVPLAPTLSSPEVSAPLSDSKLNQVRLYLSLNRMLDYKLSDHIKKSLEEDFVEMRKMDPSVNADTFHHLLSLSRLVAISYGSCELTVEHWTRTKQLEKQRADRVNGELLEVQ